MSFTQYIGTFFDSLKIRMDKPGDDFRKTYVKESVSAFLKNENFSTACEVYKSFFDCYRIKLEGEVGFIDLLDTLLYYEKRAATLIDKQRDHYIHSVNVFVLGLSVYSQNKNYSSCFKDNVFDRFNYTGRFDCPREEFLFRWGIASLFHDIGYPVEIVYNQISSFMKFVTQIDGENITKPYIDYKNFNELNNIEKIMFKDAFVGEYKTGEIGDLDLYQPIDLLIHGINRGLPVNREAVKSALYGYLKKMQEIERIDHGFYSAIIILKWYGFLIQKSGQSPQIFFHPVLDSATAILLHNFYPHTLTKPPFNLPGLDPALHPIAFLLILCDELQEWNRAAYGSEDKKKILPHSTDVEVCTSQIQIHYITSKGILGEDFARKKMDFLSKVLQLDTIFPKGINVTCTTNAHLYIEDIRQREGDVLPRPLIENLELMAKIIHKNYNDEQLKRNPAQALEYPSWDSLPDTLKFSNIRQAKGVFEKISMMGYVCKESSVPVEAGYEQVTQFPPETIEPLAELEHNRWMEERVGDGWRFGPQKDVNAKLSPYIIPYNLLTEPIKQLDRDAVNNVFPLIHAISMKVYKLKEEQS
jgi:hypothetical protein